MGNGRAAAGFEVGGTMSGERGIILIVDDQASIRTMLSDLVSGAGFEAVLAENGEVGVKLAQEHQPGVIVMDLMMPVKSGLDAAQEIRNIPALSAVPILFLTARGQPQDEQRAMDAGGSGFIAKPFSPKQVLAKIEELMAWGGKT